MVGNWYNRVKAFEYYYDDEANEFIVYALVEYGTDHRNETEPEWYFWAVANDYEEVKAIAGGKPLRETTPDAA